MKRIISLIVLVVFTISTIHPTKVYAQSVSLPQPGTMIGLSPAYTPAIIAGLTIHPENPLQFDFIIDIGDDQLNGENLKSESDKLIRYFMAALTVPENEMWVNLSPYEKDRIIAQGLGSTAMGRDMLAQDYILKQLTASMLYPESDLGKQFWQRVYEKAQEKFGTTDIPTDTFNKIWIIPQEASIYINDKNVFIADSRLKVMLEEDYLALEHHDQGLDTQADKQALKEETKAILREILIPEIEKEVNEGKNFAALRQIYHSMILATWYKKNLKQSLLSQAYADQNKTSGIDLEDKNVKEEIYNQYLEAFKQGVYDYTKEDYDSNTQEVVSRKYFSGGEDFAQLSQKAISATTVVSADSWLEKRKAVPKVSVATEVKLNSADAASIVTPAWPKQVPAKSDNLESNIKKVLAFGNLLLLRINHQIATEGKVQQRDIDTFLNIVGQLTYPNHDLFHDAVSRVEQRWGKLSETASFEEQMRFINRVLFYLNVSSFVKSGWLIDVGNDENGLIKMRREKVKTFEVVRDQENPVILAQVDVDDKSMPGYRILYDSKGINTYPGAVILGELTDEEIDAEYDNFLEIANDAESQRAVPTLTKVFGYISTISKEQFRTIYRNHVFREEWGHYQEFKEVKDFDDKSTIPQLIRRHLNVGFPENSQHPLVKMIRNNYSLYFDFHESQGHEMPFGMVQVLTETNMMVRELYFAPSYEDFLVALASTTQAILFTDEIRREAARMTLYSLEKWLKGESGPTTSEKDELDRFSEEMQRFVTIPEIAKLDARELYAKLKSLDAASVVSISDVGGIDFNAANLDLKSNGQEIKFDLPDNLKNIQPQNVNGLTPVIINIIPIVNFPLLLGQNENTETPALSRL